jgi:hypothetical protein
VRCDRVTERGDLGVEEIDVTQDPADQQRVLGAEANTLERLDQRRGLGLQPALRQGGQRLRVALAGDQRVEHQPARDAEDVGGDAVELDPGVLQALVQPVDLLRALADQRPPPAGQLPQLPHRLGWHQASAQQAELQQLAQPLRVTDIRFPAGDVLDVRRVAQHQLEVALQHRPYRPPVDAGGFHRDVRDPVRLEPVGHRQQPAHGRLELLHLLATGAPILARHPHARRHLLLVHVKRARPVDHSIHRSPPISTIHDPRRPRGPSNNRRVW